MKLREANTADCELLYEWANDKEVRENAVNQSFIHREDHNKWFKTKISSPDTKIFILEDSGRPVAQIRFDKEEAKTYWITYSIDKNYRGMGYGRQIVKAGIEQMPGCTLLALVRTENIASLKIFKQLNFEQFSDKSAQDGFIRFKLIT